MAVAVQCIIISWHSPKLYSFFVAIRHYLIRFEVTSSKFSLIVCNMKKTISIVKI